MSAPKLRIAQNGVKFWKLDGKLHREDGPAIISPDGLYNGWWFNNSEYTFDAWCKVVKISDEEKALLKLEYM